MDRRRNLVLGCVVAAALALVAGFAFVRSEPVRHPDPSLTPMVNEQGDIVGYVRTNGSIAGPSETIYDKYGTPIGTLPSTPGTVGH